MAYAIHSLWADEKGQDIAEYAVMLAVILVLVIGTTRLVGTHANTVFSKVASWCAYFQPHYFPCTIA